ncbi:DgyrCDS3322 [Dimorphilus gyrociliatus]|uniref:28S ribosomal protein S14, mitochondrial n=1 Tax=Dimorphilus gyrociliatus TaxID=2664684 RepID=A0A7I8VDZ5_9ANNE|nr:DgyrCDS3322 [Dimorphilus gyrociliatus]
MRFRYVDWLMLRDVKRRKLTAEYAQERMRYKALINNNILPEDLRESADMDMRKLPRDSLRWRIVDRCVITSRARGNVPRWRMSRFIFRHNADYNKLSGVTKAKW